LGGPWPVDSRPVDYKPVDFMGFNGSHIAIGHLGKDVTFIIHW
jgi:hypothetical protein